MVRQPHRTNYLTHLDEKPKQNIVGMMRSFFLLLLVTAVQNDVVVGSRRRSAGTGNTGPERKRHYFNPNHHREQQQQQLSQQQQRRRMMDSSMIIISSSATRASPNDEEGILCSCSPTTLTFKLDLCQTCDDNTISDNTGLDGSFCFTETENVSLPGGDPLEEEEDKQDKGQSSRTATDEEMVRYLQDKACAANEQRKYHSEKINGRTRCTNGDTDTTLDAAVDMFDSSEECCSATFKDVTNCLIVDICLPVVPKITSSVLTTSSSSTGTNSDGTSTGCNDNDNDPITEIISIQFLEFDTSGDLNVINQDNTYLTNISLTTGDTVSYTSISSYLDTTSPLSTDSYSTNNSPPGGASLILYGKTASGSIVRNRFFWTYSLSCTNDNVPLVVGDSIGWVTVSEISNAWPVFCPALPSNTPTITPGLTTAPTEVFPTSMPTPTVTGESTPHGTDDGNNIDNTMCSFCYPDGVEFPDQILPTDDGTTCTIASEYAATLMANDVMCPTVLMAEALCCPNNSGGGGGGGTDDEPQPEPCEGNIVDVAIENQDFTTLVAAVTAAGLVDELSGEGPFTIFAPTNDAFDAIPTKLLNLLLLPENIKKLQGIILYHALSGSYPSSDLTSGDRLTLPTINGESVTISVNDAGGVMVNDANVIQTDIIACNGIIHVIDLVLLPPGDEGTFGPDIGDDDEMMSMPRSKAALEDWSQAEKEYFLQNFAL